MDGGRSNVLCTRYGSSLLVSLLLQEPLSVSYLWNRTGVIASEDPRPSSCYPIIDPVRQTCGQHPKCGQQLPHSSCECQHAKDRQRADQDPAIFQQDDGIGAGGDPSVRPFCDLRSERGESDDPRSIDPENEPNEPIAEHTIAVVQDDGPET